MALPTGKAIDAAYLKTQLKNFDTVILENKYQKILQFATMPAAADNKGIIVQYVGETTIDYTTGYFYQSKEVDGADKWVAISTQAEAQEYTIKKEETAETGMAATYQLYKGETAVGDKINVPKDWVLKNVEIKTCSTDDDPVAGYKVGDKYFDFEFNTADTETGTETIKHVYLKANELVDVYTGGDGIAVDSSTNVISLDIASISGLEIVSAEGADKGKVEVKAYNGIEVTANGVGVKADAAGPIDVTSDGVNINIADELKVNDDNKLALVFETVNIDFENDWN